MTNQRPRASPHPLVSERLISPLPWSRKVFLDSQNRVCVCVPFHFPFGTTRLGGIPSSPKTCRTLPESCRKQLQSLSEPIKPTNSKKQTSFPPPPPQPPQSLPGSTLGKKRGPTPKNNRRPRIFRPGPGITVSRH